MTDFRLPHQAHPMRTEEFDTVDWEKLRRTLYYIELALNELAEALASISVSAVFIGIQVKRNSGNQTISSTAGVNTDYEAIVWDTQVALSGDFFRWDGADGVIVDVAGWVDCVGSMQWDDAGNNGKGIRQAAFFTTDSAGGSLTKIGGSNGQAAAVSGMSGEPDTGLTSHNLLNPSVKFFAAAGTRITLRAQQNSGADQDVVGGTGAATQMSVQYLGVAA